MILFKKSSKARLAALLAASFSSGLLFILYTSSEQGYKAKHRVSNNQSNSYAQEFSDVNLDFIEPGCETYDKFSTNLSHLTIEIPQSRQWSKNIIEAYATRSKIISRRYRRKFSAKVTANKSQCPLKASIRISGDLKDHLSMHNGSPTASLDVSLKNGNVGGVTRFKLFLPETRNGINEVVTANLFSYLGMIAPRTSLVKVMVNDIELPYIFQEKAAKEMLEANHRRESAIYKFDESLMWIMRERFSKPYNSLVFPAVINNKWSVRNSVASSITNKGLNKLSYEFARSNKNLIHAENPLDERRLAGYSVKAHQKQSLFITLSMITNSLHGLQYNHNRRFYFNPFENQLENIYYDGNSKYNSLTGSSAQFSVPRKILVTYKDFVDLDFAEKILKTADFVEFQQVLNKNGVRLDSQAIANLKKELLNNLSTLRGLIAALPRDKKNIKLNSPEVGVHEQLTQPIKLGEISLSGTNKAVACHPHLEKCFMFFATQKELKDIYRGLFKKDSLAYKFKSQNLIPEDYENTLIQKPSQQGFAELGLSSAKLRIYGKPEINLDPSKKLLRFKLNSHQDKIVIYGGTIDGWKIEGIALTSSPSLEASEARFDENLLTSSLTIQDASINGLNLSFNGGLLEDSINLVRVKGSISSIYIANSFQDALDVDFSDLNISSIVVRNAGNDCVDFSSGNYSVVKSDLNGCNDKGISVGEKSKANFNTVLIRNAKVAFVSKDSSILAVNNAVVKDTVLCAASYRKKQEFAGAKLSIPVNACSKKDIFAQENSEILLK